jgi:ABC-2 type transport system permease protein
MRGFLPVLKKEALQMIRDRGTLRFALLIPAFQLVLFGLIDTNVKHVRTVVLDQSRTQESRQLLTDFVNTSYFDIVAYAPSRAAMREFIVAGRASVGVEIPPDYGRRRLNGDPADVLVLIDGSDSSMSTAALAAANGLTLSRSLEELAAKAGAKDLPIRTHPLFLFNPDSRSANLLIPGLVAILLSGRGAPSSSSW